MTKYGSKWFPAADIRISSTEFSIGEYCLATDMIQLWGWGDVANVKWYRKRGENFLQLVARVIAHEEMHRILFHIEGMKTTFYYDCVTTCDIEDLV